MISSTSSRPCRSPHCTSKGRKLQQTDLAAWSECGAEDPLVCVGHGSPDSQSLMAIGGPEHRDIPSSKDPDPCCLLGRQLVQHPLQVWPTQLHQNQLEIIGGLACLKQEDKR